LLVWISLAVYSTLTSSGITFSSDALNGKTIRVSGFVGRYGGRNEPWKKYQQITLESAEAFTIVEVEETTKNADVESPKRTEDADKN